MGIKKLIAVGLLGLMTLAPSFSQFILSDTQGNLVRAPSGVVRGDTASAFYGDAISPIMLSAEVGLYNDSIVVALFDENLHKDSVPATSAFYITEGTGSSPQVDTDDFGTDYNPLHTDTDWEQGNSTFQATGGTAVHTGGGNEGWAYHAGTYDEAQYAEAIISDFGPGSHYIGPAVRADADSAYILYSNTATWYLFWSYNGSFNQLATNSYSPSANDTLKLHADGTTITAYHNSTQLTQQTDGNIVVGNPGIGGYSGSTAAITAFEGGELGGAGPPPEMGVYAVSINFDSLFLALDSLAEEGESYLLDYTAGNLQDSSENYVASLTDTIITNNVGAAPPPDTAYQWNISSQLRDSIDATQVLGFDPTTTIVTIRADHTGYPTSPTEGTGVYTGDTVNVKAKHYIDAPEDNYLLYVSGFVSNGTYNTEYNKDTTLVDSVGSGQLIPEGGDWFLAYDGDDANGGTSTSDAVQSVPRLQALASSMSANDTIYVKAGGAYKGTFTPSVNGLLIDGQSWGLETDSVIWTGGDTLDDSWTTKGNLHAQYKVDTEKGLFFSIDNVIKPPGIGPWKTVTGTPVSSTTTFYDNTITEASGYWEGGYAQAGRSSNWAFNTLLVTDHTTTTLTTTAGGYYYATNALYRIINHKGVLNEQFEIAHQDDSVIVYSTVSLSGYDVLVSQLDHAIDLTSVTGTEVQGISFTLFQDNAIETSSSGSTVIDSCGFYGVMGVSDFSNSDNFIARANIIRYTAEDAFTVNSSDDGEISMNTMINIAAPEGYSGIGGSDYTERGNAIEIGSNVDNLLIENNYIDTVGNRGINFDINNGSVTSSVTQYNFLRGTGWFVCDVGAIYSVGDKANSPSTRNIIRGNIIVENLLGPAESIQNNSYHDHYPIYLDNGPSYWGVYGNFAYHAFFLMYIHGLNDADDIIVRGNSLIRSESDPSTMSWAIGAGTGFDSGHTLDSLEIKENEAVATYQGGSNGANYALALRDNGGSNPITNLDVDSNYWFNPFGQSGATYQDAIYDKGTNQTITEWNAGTGGGAGIGTMDYFTQTGQAWGSEAPWNTADDNFIVEYNPTGSSVQFTFTGNWKDKDGNAASSPYTLPAWSGIILYSDD